MSVRYKLSSDDCGLKTLTAQLFNQQSGVTSVSHGPRITVPDICGAQPLSSFFIDRNAFSIAPVWQDSFRRWDAELDVIAHLAQGAYRVGRKPFFNIQDIGQPLIVKSWSVYRLLNVHPVVDHTHHDVSHGGDDL